MDSKELIEIWKKWAEKNNFILNPAFDLDSKAKKCLEIGKKCFCDPKRICPCPQSLEEVKKYNACLCTLFVNDLFLKEGRNIEKWKKDMAGKADKK